MSAFTAVPAAGSVAETLRPSVLMSSDGVVEMAHRRLVPQLARPRFRMDELFVKSFAVYEAWFREAVARERLAGQRRPGSGWPSGPVPFVLTDRGVAAGQGGDIEALVQVIR